MPAPAARVSPFGHACIFAYGGEMNGADFKTVLAAVDLSELSGHALRYAALVARCTSSPLTAVYSNWFEAPPYFTSSQLQELKQAFRNSIRQAETSLKRFALPITGEAAVDFRVVDDTPAEAILKTAEAVEAGLIVMGTHGRTGYNRWLLGSVAERVLRESPVPVLTVRSAPPERLGRILVPVEDTEISRHALETAVGLAACSGAEITVFHVGGSSHPIANLCAWVPATVRAQCQIRELTKEDGDAASGVIELAASGAYDLIVLGAPRRKFFGGMVMGATALRTIRHAQCPVLTVGAA